LFLARKKKHQLSLIEGSLILTPKNKKYTTSFFSKVVDSCMVGKKKNTKCFLIKGRVVDSSCLEKTSNVVQE
jgi:hypothetical protein